MILLLLSGFAFQDKPADKPQDEVIELKGEGSRLIVGRVTSITDTSIEVTTKDGKSMTLDVGQVHPASLYRLKAARTDPKNAEARWALGDFCKTHQLYAFAADEYDKAAGIDPSLKDKAKKAKDDMRGEDARSKFERAKRLGAEKKYTDAFDILKQLVERFPDTPYAEEARKELDKLTAEVAKENEAKRAELDEKKKRKDDEAAKAAENAEKMDLKRAQDFIAEAKAAWNEGLDWEAKANITKSDKAWKLSDARLAAARTLCERLEKSNDVAMIKSAKDLEKEIDGWIVRTCYRLGRLWATELNYSEAIGWINKGIKLEPDHHLLNEVLLTLTQLKMRKNAAGGGY